MDILNYGKKIGIEFNDAEKMIKFKNLIYNQLDNIHEVYCYSDPALERDVCKNYFNIMCIENNDYHYHKIKYLLKNINI